MPVRLSYDFVDAWRRRACGMSSAPTVAIIAAQRRQVDAVQSIHRGRDAIVDARPV